MNKFFWGRLDENGVGTEQYPATEFEFRAATAQGLIAISIPEGRDYGDWVGFSRDGFEWPVWERDWSAFRNAMTHTPEFLAIDIAAESSPRLSHRMGSFNAAITNLIKGAVQA